MSTSDNLSDSNKQSRSIEDQLDAVIGEQRKERPPVFLQSKVYGIEELYLRIESLEKYVESSLQCLEDRPLSSNIILWLYIMNDLLHQLVSYKDAMDITVPNGSTNRARVTRKSDVYEDNKENNTVIGNLANCRRVIAKLFISVNKYSRQLIEHGTPQLFHYMSTPVILEKEIEFMGTLFTGVLAKFSDGDDCYDLAESLFLPSASFFHGFYEKLASFNDSQKKSLIILLFPVLVKFNHACYRLGQSRFIVKFLSPQPGFEFPIINPKYPISVINSLPLKYEDIINYYKYVAFNLVTLSIGDSKILQHYNDLAEPYFITLLSFPRFEISLPQFANYLASNSFESVTLERKEVSLLYVLSYLLRLDDIRNISNPKDVFIRELELLVKTLSLDLTEEMRVLGRSHSTVSLDATESELEPSTLVDHEKDWTRSLGSILANGTYKEKLVLVITFFDIFTQGLEIPKVVEKCQSNDESLMSFSHQVSLMDEDRFLGKSLYVKSIKLVIKLIVGLSVKSMFIDGGMNNVTESYLKGILHYDGSILEALHVKHFVKVDTRSSSNGDLLLHFSLLPSQLIRSEALSNQLQLSRSIKELNEFSSNLD